MKHIVGTLAIFMAGFVVALNLIPPGTYEAAWWKVFGCIIAAGVVSATDLLAVIQVDPECAECAAADALIAAIDAARKPDLGVSDACEENLLPEGAVCPRCGGPRAPSGIDGGSWVHFPSKGGK